MVSAITTSLAGLQAASQKVADSATRIAQGGDAVDFVTEAVNLKLAETEFKANLKTLETERELSDELGRLFDKRV